MAERPHVPTEVLQFIFQHLQLAPLRLGDLAPDDRYRADQAALRNICLSSRLFQSIAEPLLYQTIVIHGNSSPVLYLVLRTLAERPDLATLVTSLAFTADVELLGRWMSGWLSERLSRSAHGAGSLFQPPLHGPGILTASGLSTSIQPSDPKLVERQLASLLCLTRNVRTLLLEARPHQDLSTVHEVLKKRMTAKTPMGSGSNPPLPDLETLQLQAHPQIDEGGTYLQTVGTQAFPQILLDHPNVRTLDTYHVTAEDNTSCDWLRRIHKMRLYTGMSTYKLLRALRVADNLKNLELVMDCFDQAFFDNGVDPSWVIEQHAQTLEDLRFSTRGNYDYTWILMSNYRLDCLPRMGQLRTLRIDTNLLFYKKSVMAELNLAAVLPPRMRELQLDEYWYDEEHAPDDTRVDEYRALLLSQFQSLASARPGKLPELEYVHFWSGDWVDFTYWTDQLASSFVQEAKGVFDAANIRFATSWGPMLEPEPLMRRLRPADGAAHNAASDSGASRYSPS